MIDLETRHRKLVKLRNQIHNLGRLTYGPKGWLTDDRANDLWNAMAHIDNELFEVESMQADESEPDYGLPYEPDMRGEHDPTL